MAHGNRLPRRRVSGPATFATMLRESQDSTTENLILCFHLVDCYRGKKKFRLWLELIITCFTDYPRIRLLDEWIHTFEGPYKSKQR